MNYTTESFQRAAELNIFSAKWRCTLTLRKRNQKGLVGSKRNEHDGLLSCPALSSEFSEDALGGRESSCELSWRTTVVCLCDCFLMQQIQVIHTVKLSFSVTIGPLNLIWTQLDRKVQVSNKIATTLINKGIWWREGAQAFQSLCWGQQKCPSQWERVPTESWVSSRNQMQGKLISKSIVDFFKYKYSYCEF